MFLCSKLLIFRNICPSSQSSSVPTGYARVAIEMAGRGLDYRSCGVAWPPRSGELRPLLAVLIIPPGVLITLSPECIDLQLDKLDDHSLRLATVLIYSVPAPYCWMSQYRHPPAC